jgi:hypothetical protein
MVPIFQNLLIETHCLLLEPPSEKDCSLQQDGHFTRIMALSTEYILQGHPYLKSPQRSPNTSSFFCTGAAEHGSLNVL